MTALRRPDPFPDPRLFRRGTFGVLNAIVGLQMLILFGIFFPVPLLLVVLQGVSDARTGVASRSRRWSRPRVTRVAEGERAGHAVGVFNATRLVSGALGTALFTLVFQLGSITPGASLDAIAPDSLAAGFRAVFAGMSVAGALALVLALAWGARFWRPSAPPRDTRERGSGGR